MYETLNATQQGLDKRPFFLCTVSAGLVILTAHTWKKTHSANDKFLRTVAWYGGEQSGPHVLDSVLSGDRLDCECRTSGLPIGCEHRSIAAYGAMRRCYPGHAYVRA